MQLTSNRGAAVLKHVKSVGIEHKFNMLPVLKKPYETEAVVKIIQELKLGMAAATANIELEQALANNWIEFWYQPKIDLRKKQLAGAEAYARARHPQHGVLLPGAFMAGAADASVIKLSELALASALNTGIMFSKLGVNIPLTVNIQPAIVDKLAIEDIVKAQRPRADHWPGLVIDLREEDIISDLALAGELGERLEPHNMRLAIDEFGGGYSALAQFGEMPFVELKLDRKFIADCGTDKVNMPLCKSVIDLAHSYRRNVVAMGIEKAADARRWSAWAAISARASCSASRCRRSASSRCCGSVRGQHAIGGGGALACCAATLGAGQDTGLFQWVQASRRLKEKLSE